jgi:predicted nucleic acid-binding protein
VRWYFDTSVLVAAAVSNHPQHTRALAVLEDLLSGKHRGFISAHSLAEFYSVLTRTPFQPPVYPSEAWRIMEEMILPHLDLVPLTSKEYQEVVHGCAIGGWIGGRVHDSVHVRCAQKAESDRIYTFNVRDFRALAGSELAHKITTP